MRRVWSLHTHGHSSSERSITVRAPTPSEGECWQPPPHAPRTRLLHPERPGRRTADEAEPPWQGTTTSQASSLSNVCGWNRLSPSPSFKRKEYELIPLFLFATCLMAQTELEKFHTSLTCSHFHPPPPPGIHMHVHTCHSPDSKCL